MTQEGKVLKMLKRRPVTGVKNYEFPPMRVLRYGAVIKRLRDEGHHITAEKIGNTGVWIYKLVEPEKPDTTGTPKVEGMAYERTENTSNWFRDKAQKLIRNT